MAKVFVWTMKLRAPNLSAGSAEGVALSTVQNIGHSALLCDRVAVPPGPLSDDPRYVSYWPDAPVGLKTSSSGSYRTPSYADDVAAEGGPPEHTVDLPCLDDAAIVQWWSAFRAKRSFIGPYALQYWPKDDHYDLWRTNCSTMVALAMKIGGADRYTVTDPIGLTTPADLLSYAKAVATQAKVNDFVKGVWQKITGR